MGHTLGRTACSANIKERRDHSCALFDADGILLAQAAHIPVHLGSMAASVRAARNAAPMRPGDAVLLNDPFAGGTHLPDLTLVSPVYDGETRVGFAANRAHHADVGGAQPGSMGVSSSIHQEGLRIPPVRWFADGVEQHDVRAMLLANMRGSQERRGDLLAQASANEIGSRALRDLRARYGDGEFDALSRDLLNYSERLMRCAIAAIPDGDYFARDFLEGDGIRPDDVVILARVSIRGDEAHIDFAGTSDAVEGCVNCPLSVAEAAVAYVFVCLAGSALPHNGGMTRPIRVSAPAGCLVNAAYPSAVAAGNVETSQRIVDVLLTALASALPDRIPAGSAGTMNSLSLGGIDPRSGRPFTYYETIAGGSGGSAEGPGESGVQTHMTNTRNTPTEALESAFPVRLERYRMARGSGGDGQHAGGDGIIRAITALSNMNGALLADRHRRGPAGQNGGAAGRPGSARIVRANGEVQILGCKCSFELRAGDCVEIVTPGGGACGAAPAQVTG